MSERTSRGPLPARCLLLAVLALAGCRDGGGGSGDDGDEQGSTGGPEDTGVESGTTGDDADTTGADTTADDTDTDGPPIDVIPPPGGLRRVLSHQYIATIELLLGPEAAAAASPPPDPSLGGFDAIAAIESSLSPPDVEQYEGSAKDVAAAVVEYPDTLAFTVPCIAADVPPADCYETLAQELGRLAWRRPLTEEEYTPLVALANQARTWDGDKFMSGVEYMIVALLQSPRFLYIVEVGTPSEDGPRELTQYELATRMAFFLLGRGPDITLLDRAEDGLLATDEQIKQIANDLLASPRARGTLNRFYSEYLTIRDLPSKGKDPVLFPGFDESLANAMIEETHRLVEDIVFEQDGNVLDVYDSPTTFVNDQLAALYGIAAPPAGEWEEVTLPAAQHRAGVFTHASWLATMSHGELNSPSRRGLFLQEQVLCNEIPPVPPDVNTMLTPPPDGMSLREWLETMHVDAGASCSGCHDQFDPIGFAFESYDPIGAYRTEDNGITVDASGSVGGLGDWENAEEMLGFIRADVRVSGCLVKQVWVSALGFSDVTEQIEPLMQLDDGFAAADFNMKNLLAELTASDVFRHVEEPK